MKNPLSRHQRGVSLVEVAIASVILGACGTLLMGVIDRQAKVASVERSTTLVDRAHDAILAYAYLHRGLPCPSQVTTGVETCDGHTEGYLPYVTLGLPEPTAGRLRYRMSLDLKSPTASSPYSVVTSQRTGEFGDLTAQVVRLASISPAGHEALFDLCSALASAGNAAQSAYAVGVAPEAAMSAAITTPSSAPPVHEETIGRSQFAAKLQCGALATAGRAHFNAALAADTMNRAMEDILAQFVLVKGTYVVDLLQGKYFLANSIYSLHRANTKRLGALAASQASNGVDSHALSIAQAKTALAGAYTVGLSINAARFAINLAHAEMREQTLRELRTRTNRAATDIRARAMVGSASAFFLEDKWSSVAP